MLTVAVEGHGLGGCVDTKLSAPLGFRPKAQRDFKKKSCETLHTKTLTCFNLPLKAMIMLIYCAISCFPKSYTVYNASSNQRLAK